MSSMLAQLLRHIADQAPHKYSADALAKGKASGGHLIEQFNVWPGEIAETDYFQKAWARLGTSSQLRQAQNQVPENSGPLNSSHLIHRALLLMHEQSPGYLEHFLAYVDTLSWMEPLNAAVDQPDKAALPQAKPGARAKAGTRPAKTPSKKTSPKKTAAKRVS